MKIGDKVKLKYIPDDLRYNVKLEDIGVITEFLDTKRGKYSIVVKWYLHEPAMTHKPDELEIVNGEKNEIYH
jgi:hypothetical protein